MSDHVSKVHDAQMRLLIANACERLGRHGLVPSETALEALYSLVATASTLGRSMDKKAWRRVLVQAVENVKASERAKPSTFGSLGAYGGADAVLREYDRLMRRLSDDESTNSAENPPSEPNHG